FADAVHDEGDLRAVPAIAARPCHRHRDGGVLLLQPGPGDGPGRFPGIAPPALAEQRTGKIEQAVDRPLPAAPRLAPGDGGGVGGRRFAEGFALGSRIFAYDCGMAYFTAPPVKLATKRSTKTL